ncbi:MAG: hypothetical protein E7584_02245 [Ruminococcaceae bacterium]|nr:hypothetical protein [Oscillospiraceae bacterium]
MRKLSLLIALCTLLTVGGVYAAWTYTNETIPQKNAEYDLFLTEDETVGNYGVYEVVTSADFAMKIDPDPDADNNHTTKLFIDGYITIYFRPDENAPQNIVKNGPATEFFFELTNEDWKFNDGSGEKNIVTLNRIPADATHPINPTETGEHEWTYDEATGTFSYVISNAELVEHIELTEFLLDTRSDYLAFQSALSNGRIKLTVQDATGVSALR